MIVILIVATIFSWIMVGVLFLGMISKPSEIKSLVFLWVALVAFGILIGNHAIWELMGKVRISISDESLRITNVNTLFKKRIHIPLSDFKRIEYVKEESNSFFWLYGFVQGDIVVFYKNGQRRFGRGLNRTKSVSVIRKIESEIADRLKNSIILLP